MSDPAWDCPNCETRNTMDPAVVDLSVTVYDKCDNCGERYQFDVRGKTA